MIVISSTNEPVLWRTDSMLAALSETDSIGLRLYTVIKAVARRYGIRRPDTPASTVLGLHRPAMRVTWP